jgi:hypothetical protein
VGITFGRLSPSYWIDYLGFITEGKLAAIFIKPFLGVSNWPVIFTSSTNANKFSGTIVTAPSTSFLASLPGIEEEEAPHQLHIPTSTRHHQTVINGLTHGRGAVACRVGVDRTNDEDYADFSIRWR